MGEAKRKYTWFTPRQKEVADGLYDGKTLVIDLSGAAWMLDGSSKERINMGCVNAMLDRGMIRQEEDKCVLTQHGRTMVERSRKYIRTRKANKMIQERLEDGGSVAVKQTGLLAARNGLYVELFSTLIREVVALRVSIDKLTEGLT